MMLAVIADTKKMNGMVDDAKKSTAPSVPRRSPIQVLTGPDAA